MKVRPFAGALTAAGGVLAVVIGLVAIDDEIRENVVRLFRGDASAEIAAAGYHLRSMTSIVIQAVKDQSLEHAPLMIFGLAATVLVLFMLRT